MVHYLTAISESMRITESLSQKHKLFFYVILSNYEYTTTLVPSWDNFELVTDNLKLETALLQSKQSRCHLPKILSLKFKFLKTYKDTNITVLLSTLQLQVREKAQLQFRNYNRKLQAEHFRIS